MERKLIASIAVSATLLSGCYVVPVGPDGQLYAYPPGVIPTAALPPVASTGAPPPVTLHARLYPENEIAARTGVLTGSVVNLRNGKGRFELNYRGDTLVGEATRATDDERGGIAAASGARGAYMNCQYRMNSPTQGSGQCTFSDGARYQVHLGG